MDDSITRFRAEFSRAATGEIKSESDRFYLWSLGKVIATVLAILEFPPSY